MVEIEEGGHDGPVVTKTTVWEVELRQGGPMDDRKGSLALEADALVFEPADGGAARRIALAEVRKLRRLRGSPVLLVIHAAGSVPVRIAYYFAQPPPLERTQPLAQERFTLVAMRKNSKRHVRRQNVGYLGMWNRQKKELLASWERAVRAAMDDGTAER